MKIEIGHKTFGCVKGVKIKFKNDFNAKIKEVIKGAEIDSEDSFDKDYTVFKDLRAKDLRVKNEEVK